MRSVAILVLLGAACHQSPASHSQQPTIGERAWLAQSLWDDGKSEIAFYEGHLDTKDGRRTFSVATQLTKQSFDRVNQAKSASGVPAFKWTLFFELTSGNEQFEHSYVANLAQVDLSPFKVSANRFDWYSNQYRELAFLRPGEVHVLARSDDYGTSEQVVDHQKLTYPAVAVPLLVRSVDFSRMSQVDFSVMMLDGTHVDAMAESLGEEKITAGTGEIEAQKIAVHYAHALDSTFGPRTGKELYWRARDPSRTLLKLESQDGAYGLRLVEAIRATYPKENLFDRLARTKAQPGDVSVP